MILEMFSMYDEKAMAFITPFFLQNENMARREINHVGGSEKHMFGRHPEDYCLYQVGTFDDTTCEVIVQHPVRRIGLVSQIMEEYDLNRVIPGES